MTGVLGVSRRALLTAALAAVLAVSTLISPAALLVVVAFGVVALALGWPTLVVLPSRRGSSAVMMTAGVLGLLAVLTTDDLSGLVAVIAFAVIAAFVHEMLRRDHRPFLTESLAGTVTGVVFVVSATGWVVIAAGGRTTPLVLTAASAVAAAGLCAALPLAVRVRGLLAMVAGGAVGGVIGAFDPALGVLAGVAVGAGIGIVTASLEVLFDRFPASGRPFAAFAIAALPVAAVGIPVYGVARLLGV